MVRVRWVQSPMHAPTSITLAGRDPHRLKFSRLHHIESPNVITDSADPLSDSSELKVAHMILGSSGTNPSFRGIPLLVFNKLSPVLARNGAACIEAMAPH